MIRGVYLLSGTGALAAGFGLYQWSRPRLLEPAVQGELASGPTDPAKVTSVCVRLELTSISTGNLAGGSCTVIALKRARAKLKGIAPKLLNPAHVRAAQLVLNAIPHPAHFAQDDTAEKMRLPLQLYGLKSVFCSPKIPCGQDFSEHVQALGVYLIRMVQPADNDRREVHGHSLLYINDAEGRILFDCNRGDFRVRHPRQLPSLLAPVARQFQLEYLHALRLETE